MKIRTSEILLATLSVHWVFIELDYSLPSVPAGGLEFVSLYLDLLG